MKIKHSTPYGPLRAGAYPKVGDQLAAIVALAQALREQGLVLPQETLDWLDKCQAVKDRYRRP